MQLWQASAGKKDMNSAVAERYLALVRQAQTRYAETEWLLRDVLAINQRAFGRRHENAAMILNDLGMLYRQEGQDRKAVEPFNRALAIHEACGNPGALGVAPVSNNLGEVAFAEKRYAEAERLYTRALQIRRNIARAKLRSRRAGSRDTRGLLS